MPDDTMDKGEAVHEEISSPRLLEPAPGDVELLRGSDTVLVPTPSADPRGESPQYAPIQKLMVRPFESPAVAQMDSPRPRLRLQLHICRAVLRHGPHLLRHPAAVSRRRAARKRPPDIPDPVHGDRQPHQHALRAELRPPTRLPCVHGPPHRNGDLVRLFPEPGEPHCRPQHHVSRGGPE